MLASPAEFPPSRTWENAALPHLRLGNELAQVLLPGLTSINVFRATLLLIVSTLAAGQNIAAFCGVWCHSGGGTAGACEPRTETTSPSVTATVECTTDGNAIVFVREEAPRSISAATAKGEALVPQFALTPRPGRSVSGYERGRRPLIELRPLALTLRI